MIEELSHDEAKRRQQEAVIDDRRKVIRSLREYEDDKEKRAKDLRDEAHTIDMEAEIIQQNLDSDPHKRKIQEGIIKDKRKEVKSLRKQALRVSPDADGSHDDEDEGNCEGIQEMPSIWMVTNL